MANLHNILLQYSQSISLTSARKKKLTATKKAVETAIKGHFKNNTRIVVPSFFIQGSYKMKTMIVKKDNTYDVDLGVYFNSDPGIEAKTLQLNVLKAVKYRTVTGATHKEKCIRVNYLGEFNIDLPVYYYEKETGRTFLATKTGWEESDSKDLVNWYFDSGGDGQQLQRIIKYLKAWADNHRNKLPSGIALTVWGVERFSAHRRDDIALFNTLLGIKKHIFWNGVSCTNPTPPGDDLALRLTHHQKTRFKAELKNLINDLDVAIDEDTQVTAIKRMKKHFGARIVPRTI